MSDERAHHGARHVAIIMDGNGRWANKRHLPRVVGHQRGVEAVRALVRAARGKWRALAQRPLPSMIMATWRAAGAPSAGLS